MFSSSDKLEGKNLNEEDYLAIYKSALKVHNKQTDSEVIDFIQQNHSTYCEDEEEKKQIVADLEDIMEADGVIKDVEMIMYRFIKKTLLPA